MKDRGSELYQFSKTLLARDVSIDEIVLDETSLKISGGGLHSSLITADVEVAYQENAVDVLIHVDTPDEVPRDKWNAPYPNDFTAVVELGPHVEEVRFGPTRELIWRRAEGLVPPASWRVAGAMPEESVPDEHSTRGESPSFIDQFTEEDLEEIRESVAEEHDEARKESGQTIKKGALQTFVGLLLFLVSALLLMDNPSTEAIGIVVIMASGLLLLVGIINLINGFIEKWWP